MIRTLYLVMSAVMAVTVIDGLPIIDIFSQSWHGITRWTLYVGAFFSAFATIIGLLGYIDEKDNLDSDYVKFFLRTAIGLKFLPKWPVVCWLVLACLLIQFNQLPVAIAVLFLTVFAGSVVFIQNSLYTRFITNEAKGE